MLILICKWIGRRRMYDGHMGIHSFAHLEHTQGQHPPPDYSTAQHSTTQHDTAQGSMSQHKILNLGVTANHIAGLQ